MVDTRYTENYEIEHMEAAREMKKQIENTYKQYTVKLELTEITIPSMPRKRYRTLAEITKKMLEHIDKDDVEYIDSDDDETNWNKNNIEKEKNIIKDNWKSEDITKRIEELNNKNWSWI
jgi:broad specificity polyphosphatase/5'/3'-nucleotidase SurE